MENCRDYLAKDNAKRYFLEGKNLEDIKIEIPDISNIYLVDIINYINNADEFINDITKKHIEENLKRIYINFLCVDMCRIEFEKIQNDKTNTLHLRKAIIGCITTQKTVNVTISKDNKEFTFKTRAKSLKRESYDECYLSCYMDAKDERKFEEIFGENSHYTADEIVKITYCKKAIYTKEVI